jgi:hypothetical protein
MLPTVTSPNRASTSSKSSLLRVENSESTSSTARRRAKTSVSPKRREHSNPESPLRRGVRSQGQVRLGPLTKTKKKTRNKSVSPKISKKAKRRRDEARRAREHAELLAQAEAVRQAAFVRGLGAITVGQDTPPMSAGSVQEDRKPRLYAPESTVYYDIPPPSSSLYSRQRGVSSLGSSSISYAQSKSSTTTTTSVKSGVLPTERLHTPDLEMMKMAMHGSLFQRLRQNFRAGMFGNRDTYDGTSSEYCGIDNRGYEILNALNANNDNEGNIKTFVEQDASTMMALKQSQPHEAVTVLFGEGSPLSRQGFASNTPKQRKRQHKKKTVQDKSDVMKMSFSLNDDEGGVSSITKKIKNVDPNFSRKLLPLADPSHYWDVRNVSHELKWSAITIQRYVRGLLARIFTTEFRYQVKLKKMKRAHDAATLIQKHTRRYLYMHDAHNIALKLPEGQFLLGSSLCDDPYKIKLNKLLDWIHLIKGGSQGVQKLYRGMIGRRQALGHKIDVLRKRLEKKSATSIQAIVRGYRLPAMLKEKLKQCHIIRIWMLGRIAKLRAIALGKKIRAEYLQKRAAVIEVQRWFPRAVETRGLGRRARAKYLHTRKAIIKLQSFNRMIIATNLMNFMSAVREQERLAERRRIERERLEEIERQRIKRWTKAAIIVQNWTRCLQALSTVERVRARKKKREHEYKLGKIAYDEFKLIIPENGDVQKLTAKPILGFVFMHIEPRLRDVKEDVALLSGKNVGLKLDVWYQHNMMTQPQEPYLFYVRSIVEYYRTVQLSDPNVQEFLRKGRLLDSDLSIQNKIIDMLETSWRLDMDNGFKGCMFALGKVLFLKDMLGAARSMRRARKNSKYDAKIVAHAKKFDKEFSALVARGDHFVNIIHETTIVLPPQRAKYRVQALLHENNLQFRSLRYDFVVAGVKPSGAETRLVFTHVDAIDIASKLDRPELTRSGRVKQLVMSLIPMLRLETGAAAEKAKRRRPGTKKKAPGKKTGGKKLVVRFKQEPFPKLTTLTKGRGKNSLPPKFLSIIVLHREDGGFFIQAKGDMTDPPTGNPDDEYKLILPFNKLKKLFLDYPVLWKSRQRPGWRRRSDQLIALVVERLEICKKPKPEKKGVHEMSFAELMRMSAAVDQQKKQLEGDQNGEKVPDQPPELVLLFHNEKGRIRQAELGYGAQAYQRCWRGLKGRIKATSAKENRASREIVAFIKYNRARVWFRDITIYAKKHFRSIEMQSIARGYLIRLAFQKRLKLLFPFSRGSWHVAYPAMIAQRPLPLKLGYILMKDVSKIELSDLTQRAMWTLAVDDDDERVLTVLKNHSKLSVQPNLIYGLAIATRTTMKKNAIPDKMFKTVQHLIEKARIVDPERGRKFNIVREMFFERWYKIQFNNPLKALRCAIMYEIVYNDYDQAQRLYDESKRLLSLKAYSNKKTKSLDRGRHRYSGNIHNMWTINYKMFRKTLLERSEAAKKIQTTFRGHCNKRVHGEWLAALIKFRRTSLKQGFEGRLAQALGYHYLWHDEDSAIELYNECHRLDRIGRLLTDQGRSWVEEQFNDIDKLKRGGLTEKEYHVFLEYCAVPEMIAERKATIKIYESLCEENIDQIKEYENQSDERKEEYLKTLNDLAKQIVQEQFAAAKEKAKKENEKVHGEQIEDGEQIDQVQEEKRIDFNDGQMLQTVNEEVEAKAMKKNVCRSSHKNVKLSDLRTERKDKTHIFQPKSQSSRDIFDAIGTADAELVPTLEVKSEEEEIMEEEMKREVTRAELDAMDYFGDIPKNSDGLRVSVENVWEWAESANGGRQRVVLHIGSTLINMLKPNSIKSNRGWMQEMRASMDHLEELNLTEDTLQNITEEEKAAVLELETDYVRLAARMPQERSASLLNHALFLHIVRQNSQGAGDSYSSALVENPGFIAARRGYEYFINRGMLAEVSPKQRKIQMTLQRKREKMQWRRRGQVSKEDRIATHLSLLMEEAATATLNFEKVQENYFIHKKLAKKINKLRDEEEYTEDDKEEMKKFRYWKREFKEKKKLMDEANGKVLLVRKEREESKAREGTLAAALVSL